jgi:protein-S-isoprenylcysteine O-methyltransferase Ste14
MRYGCFPSIRTKGLEAMAALEIASVGLLALYLAGFFGLTVLASRAAGRPVWLLGEAQGVERAAEWCFRLAFALGLLGPVVAAFWPALASVDPFAGWRATYVTSLPGHLVLAAGAMVAFAAQAAMGASWRVGTRTEAVGALVTDGPFAWSRNPVFLGQLLIFSGLFLALPTAATLLGLALFRLAAGVQIRAEERVLSATLGAQYLAYRARTGRWFGRSAQLAGTRGPNE